MKKTIWTTATILGLLISANSAQAAWYNCMEPDGNTFELYWGDDWGGYPGNGYASCVAQAISAPVDVVVGGNDVDRIKPKEKVSRITRSLR